jgi:hypothetical protein
MDEVSRDHTRLPEASVDPSAALAAYRHFVGRDLTAVLAAIEGKACGATATTCPEVLASAGVSIGALESAALLKRMVGEINVAIHALGVLLCLPHILKPGETVEYLSLGAGNTGRSFDLETDRRVAEFKFIHWRGGAEAIRQNGLFKDFLLLAEHETEKSRHLYVLGLDHPMRFLQGRRSLRSVLGHHVKLERQFFAKYGDQYNTVRDYYLKHRSRVAIEDVSPWLPALIDEDASFQGA